MVILDPSLKRLVVAVYLLLSHHPCLQGLLLHSMSSVRNVQDRRAKLNISFAIAIIEPSLRKSSLLWIFPCSLSIILHNFRLLSVSYVSLFITVMRLRFYHDYTCILLLLFYLSIFSNLDNVFSFMLSIITMVIYIFLLIFCISIRWRATYSVVFSSRLWDWYTPILDLLY